MPGEARRASDLRDRQQSGYREAAGALRLDRPAGRVGADTRGTGDDRAVPVHAASDAAAVGNGPFSMLRVEPGQGDETVRSGTGRPGVGVPCPNSPGVC
jgi:hypothetical protein